MTIEIEKLSDVAGTGVTSVPTIVGGGELLGMGISMLVVVAAILVLGWFYSRSRLASTGASDVINIVATRALGPKERLLVVEVAEQQLLIGMTSTTVQTLHVFEQPIRVDDSAPANSGFGARLRSALKEMGK